MMLFISGSAKTVTPRALASSPIDFVWVEGFVIVQEFDKL
jgi:hypothetical protein